MDEMVDTADSRRDALKKIAVGSAVVWTAPAVLSLSGASAQTGSAPGTDCGGVDWNCDQFPPPSCGTGGLGGLCVCDVDLAGNDFCWGNFPCFDSRAVPCTQNSDCTAGWACVTSCCGTTCAPPCDGTFTGAAGAGATGAGG